MDKTIGVSELRKSIAEKIKEVHEKRSRYIVMQHSKAKAVLLSPEEIETLEIMADRNILQDIRQAKQDIIRGEYSSYEDFFKKKLSGKKEK